MLQVVGAGGLLLVEQRVETGTILEKPRIRKVWKPKQGMW